VGSLWTGIELETEVAEEGLGKKIVNQNPAIQDMT
jgi:hypothetical protein